MIILSATTYDGSTATVTGEKYKGDGYYGRSDGLHTVAWKLTGFVGDIKMQASLAANPTDNDWFDIESTGVNYNSATTINSAYNFIGNFMWVRVVIENFSAGTVNSVYMNN